MSITGRVKSFYSRYTYPNYPILARPLWQYGYLGSSVFSGFLFQSVFNRVPSIFRYDTRKGFSSKENRKNILIVGSGEILPYISRKFELSSSKVFCVDLSSPSLKRASLRLKLGLNTKSIQFIEDDINHFLDSTDLIFDHVDCFGVAHHLDSPRETLKKIKDHLKPHGTCRIMVYNYPARWWIHTLASIFKLCGYSYSSKKDIDLARSWLAKLKKLYPNSLLSYYLRLIGDFILDSPARFSDTFLHPREIRYDIQKWFQLFKSSGLVPFGLYDRYEELDDIDQSLYPLYGDFNPSFLNNLSMKGYFLGNLELYLTTDQTKETSLQTGSKNSFTTLKDYPFYRRIFLFIKECFLHVLKSSPFKEARGLKQRLWFNWIRYIFFNIKLDKRAFQEPSFIKRGYTFPNMFNEKARSSLLKRVGKNSSSSKLESIIKKLPPTSFSYSMRETSLKQNITNLDDFNLFPKTSSSLSKKKQIQIRKRLSTLLATYQEE